MKSQEAKFILQAYRHGGEDASDPHFQEALKQVKRDPELAAWLSDDQVLFQVVNRSLKAIQVPADLKANILAGGRIVRTRPWWEQPAWLAAAAALLILLTLGSFWMSRGPDHDFVSFRTEMSEFLENKLSKLDVQSKTMATLKQYLQTAQAPSPSQFPEGLGAIAPLGCKIIDHDGSKVSLICFRDGSTLIHLLIIDNPVWSNPPPSKAQAEFAQNGFYTTASWMSGHQGFIMASKIDEQSLRKYL